MEYNDFRGFYDYDASFNYYNVIKNGIKIECEKESVKIEGKFIFGIDCNWYIRIDPQPISRCDRNAIDQHLSGRGRPNTVLIWIYNK